MRESENLAFWLSPLAAPLPLIPFFSVPTSPLFLGKLMGGATNAFLWPGVGPWLAALAVVFDGTVLAYFIAVLIYLPLFRSGRIRRDMSDATGRLSLVRVLILFGLAGIFASQIVHWAQDFREPALREFAISWVSPLFGCLCGLASGACLTLLAKRQFSPVARILFYSLPVTVVMACGATLVWSSKALGVH